MMKLYNLYILFAFVAGGNYAVLVKINVIDVIMYKGEQSYYPLFLNKKINKFHSMRETPQFGINYSSKAMFFFKNNGFLINVKMFMTRGQSACNNIRLLHQRLNVEHSKNYSFIDSDSTVSLLSSGCNIKFFDKWLVGMVDGNGSFTILSQSNIKNCNSSSSIKWNLTFKISQSSYNLRVLYYIKTMLNCGSIVKEKNNEFAHFRITDLKTIKKIILPLFDKCPLLTKKAFDYSKFRQAVFILDDNNLSQSQKNLQLISLQEKVIRHDYISSAWLGLNNKDLTSNLVTKIMSKAWLVGFIEAEGSFYLRNKSLNQIVHGFKVTAKSDLICLEAIRIILHIKTKVVCKKIELHNYYMIDTTNSRAIENIIDYFHNTMKGMKSVQYKIWARSFKNNKGKFAKLQSVVNNYKVMKQHKPD